MNAQEIADRLLDDPRGPTPERLAKAMALAQRSGRVGLFREALAIGLAARGITLEKAAVRGAAVQRMEALQAAQAAAVARKPDDPHRAPLVAHFEQTIAGHVELMAGLED